MKQLHYSVQLKYLFYNLYLLIKQVWVLQIMVSVGFPLQGIPPLAAAGFMQALERVCVPFPQVLEQIEKDDHSLQAPSNLY